MCTWVQSVSKCAHTLKVEGKLRIQMTPVEDDQVDPHCPVVVRSNHLKHYDMSNFLLRKISSAVVFLAVHKTCSCLLKVLLQLSAVFHLQIKEQRSRRVINSHDLKTNELGAFNSTEFTTFSILSTVLFTGFFCFVLLCETFIFIICTT